MKSLKILLPILFFSIFISYACSDDPAGSGSQIDLPTSENYNALIDAALETRTQTTTFDAADGISFTSKKGVELNFQGNCLTLNGNAVSGPVKLKYIELFNRGSMVVTNKPTMGLAQNGDKKMLVSGGEFYINMTQDGKQLNISCGQIELRVPGNLTGGLDKEMILWNGIIDDNNDLTWQNANADTTQDNSLFFEGQEGGAGTYYVYFNAFGWTNVDRFYSDSRPKTTLLVQPPKGYTDKNSSVYLSYDGEANALANLDEFQEDTGLFSEHYGQVPIGLKMHVIFVTEEDGQYRYAIKGVTVAEDDLYTFTLEETIVGSEQDLVDAMKALP